SLGEALVRAARVARDDVLDPNAALDDVAGDALEVGRGRLGWRSRDRAATGDEDQDDDEADTPDRARDTSKRRLARREGSHRAHTVASRPIRQRWRLCR